MDEYMTPMQILTRDILALNTGHSIDILNEDCLIHIFEHLPCPDRVRLERVCKSWQIASLKSWCSLKRLDLTKQWWGKFEASNSILESVLRRCGRFLIDFETTYFTVCRKNIDLDLLKYCPNLMFLTLGLLDEPEKWKCLVTHTTPNLNGLGFTTSKGDLALTETVFAHYKNLRKVKIQSTAFATASLSGHFLESLRYDLIEEIHLEYCEHLNEEVIYALLPKFTKLHTLSFSKSEIKCPTNVLSIPSLKKLLFTTRNGVNKNFTYLTDGCRNISHLEISGFVHGSTFYAISQLTNLEYLSIRGTRASTNFRKTCRYPSQILANLPRLRELDCSQCNWIDDQQVANMLNKSRRLERLDISECKKITYDISSKAVFKLRKTREIHTPLKIKVIDMRLESLRVPNDSNLVKFTKY